MDTRKPTPNGSSSRPATSTWPSIELLADPIGGQVRRWQADDGARNSALTAGEVDNLTRLAREVNDYAMNLDGQAENATKSKA